MHKSHSIPKDIEQLQDQRTYSETLEKLQTEQYIHLTIPEDLYQIHHNELKSIISAFNIKLNISKEIEEKKQAPSKDDKEEKDEQKEQKEQKEKDEQKKDDSILQLQFRCGTPESKSLVSPKELAKKELFRVEGIPNIRLMDPQKREGAFYTKIEQRYLKLQQEIRRQKKDPHFNVLVRHYEALRQRNLLIIRKLQEIQVIDEHVKSIDRSYYRVLLSVLVESMEKVTGVTTLEGLTKRLIKIMIIDEMGQMTTDHLVEAGFAKKYISTMALETLQATYKESQKKLKHPPHHATLKDLLRAPDLEKYDIVLVNPWVYKDRKLPVYIQLKMKTILSKKEQKLMDKDPKKVAEKIEKLQLDCLQLREQLDEVNKELNVMEIGGEGQENKYQTIRNKRKRLAGRLRKKMDRLKAAKKTVKQEVKFKIYTRDLIKTFKEKRSLMESIEDGVSSMAVLGSILKGLIPEDHLALSDLKKMGKLGHRKYEIASMIDRVKKQVKSLSTKLDKYAKKHNLCGDLTSQQLMDHHILNILEKNIIGCGIAHVNQMQRVYAGSYFYVEGIQSEAEWYDDLFSKVHVYIASKADYVPNTILRHILRIGENEVETRIHVEAALPDAEAFNSQKFQLIIIDMPSFKIQDIFDCLRTRNQSINPHIAVLITDASHRVLDLKDRLRLHYLIGVVKNENKLFTMESPPYQISTLTEKSELAPLLCEIMGIPESAVPPMEQ